MKTIINPEMPYAIKANEWVSSENGQPVSFTPTHDNLALLFMRMGCERFVLTHLDRTSQSYIEQPRFLMPVVAELGPLIYEGELKVVFIATRDCSDFVAKTKTYMGERVQSELKQPFYKVHTALLTQTPNLVVTCCAQLMPRRSVSVRTYLPIYINQKTLRIPCGAINY